MPPQELSDVLRELPFRVRENVSGYVSWVEEAAPAIFRDAGVPLDAELLREFLFLAGIRKIWALVNSEYWIVDNSLAILSDYDVVGVRLAGVDYTRNSPPYRDLQRLRADFENLLRELDIQDLVASWSLSELLTTLQEAR